MDETTKIEKRIDLSVFLSCILFAHFLFVDYIIGAYIFFIIIILILIFKNKLIDINYKAHVKYFQRKKKELSKIRFEEDLL